MSSQENQGPKVLAIIITFYILALAAIASRVISRRISSLKLWWDDWLILLAALVITTNLVILILVVHYGGGKHVRNVFPPQHIRAFLLWTYLTGITYSLIVTSVKCSILCLYLRIFSVKGTFTKVVYSVIVITVGWGIATLFSTIFQCIPVTAVWDHSAPHSHCINLNAWFIGTNVPSIILDFAILILPMRVVWHLKLSTGRKVGLSGIFLLGTAASIISILRVRANAKINFSDPTWNSVPIIIWSTVEEDVGVICACLPAMAPLIRLLFGHRFGSSQTSAAHSYPRTRNQDSRPLHHQQSLSRLNEDTFELFPDELSTVHTKGSRASREAEESATRTKALEGSIKD